MNPTGSLPMGKFCRDLGDMKRRLIQKTARLAMRSQQRPDFLEQFCISAALQAQELLLPPDWHLQRRLQQFVYSFPAFSVHRSVQWLSRRTALAATISERTLSRPFCVLRFRLARDEEEPLRLSFFFQLFEWRAAHRRRRRLLFNF